MAKFEFITSNNEIASKWFLDSCASQQMTHQRDLLYNYSSVNDGNSIATAAKDVRMRIEGFGALRLEQSIQGKMSTIEVNNVAYMPSTRTNLVSLSRAQEAGLSIEYPGGSTRMTAKHGDKIVMVECQKHYSICELIWIVASVSDARGDSFFNTGSCNDMKVMHRRACHTGVQTLSKMVRIGCADGLEELAAQTVEYEVCNECCVGKAVPVPHPRKEKQKRRVLELVYTDVAGLIEPTSLNGDKLLIAVIDDASGAIKE